MSPSSPTTRAAGKRRNAKGIVASIPSGALFAQRCQAQALSRERSVQAGYGAGTERALREERVLRCR